MILCNSWYFGFNSRYVPQCTTGKRSGRVNIRYRGSRILSMVACMPCRVLNILATSRYGILKWNLKWTLVCIRIITKFQLCNVYIDYVTQFWQACLHDGPETDPDDRDAVNTNYVTKIAQKYVSEHLPGLETSPSITESCIYTVSRCSKIFFRKKWMCVKYQ
jgi:hypothetical protein